MYCKNCKEYNKDDAQYCVRCGKPLRMRRWTRLISGLSVSAAVALAVIVFFIWQMNSGEDSRDIEKIEMNSVQKHDTKESSKTAEQPDTPPYIWKVQPQIEADDIYYVACADVSNYSVNELYRQNVSRYAVIRKGDTLGLIDMDGNLNGEMEYRNITAYFDSYYLESIEPEYIEEYGEEYSSFTSDEDGAIDILDGIEAGYFSERGFYYCGGLQGASMSGEEDIQKPDCPFPVRRGTGIMYGEQDVLELWGELDGTRYGVWNGDGLASDFIYDECGSYSDGLLAVCKNGKWGYINERGEEVIPIEFDASWKEFYPYESMAMENPEPKDYCYAASDGYVVLCKGGEWELRGTAGETAVPPGIFEEIRPVYDGMCWVKKDGKWGVIGLE